MQRRTVVQRSITLITVFLAKALTAKLKTREDDRILLASNLEVKGTSFRAIPISNKLLLLLFIKCYLYVLGLRLLRKKAKHQKIFKFFTNIFDHI